jgi:hypothetical protein
MFQSSRFICLSAAIAMVAIAWPGQSLGKGRSKSGRSDGEAAAPAGASARQPDQADELIRQGVELRKSGNDDKALEAFRTSFQLQPTPRAQAQMALAEQALGLWVDAEKDLKEALRATSDPWVSKNAKALSGAMATVEQHLGSLQLLGTPVGAVVKIDERVVGKLPFEQPIRVTAGEVLVSVSSDGYFEIDRRITVAVGRLVRESIALHAQPRLAASPVASAGDTRARPADTQLTPIKETPTTTYTEPTAAESTDSQRRFSTAQRLGIGAVVLGAAAAGVGGYFVSQAVSKNNESLRVGCEKDLCNPMGRSVREQALTAGNRATIAFAAAGVLVVGGATLLIFGRHKAEQTAWWIAPATDGERLALVGSARF